MLLLLLKRRREETRQKGEGVADVGDIAVKVVTS